VLIFERPRRSAFRYAIDGDERLLLFDPLVPSDTEALATEGETTVVLSARGRLGSIRLFFSRRAWRLPRPA
jgi:hypothetical protein